MSGMIERSTSTHCLIINSMSKSNETMERIPVLVTRGNQSGNTTFSNRHLLEYLNSILPEYDEKTTKERVTFLKNDVMGRYAFYKNSEGGKAIRQGVPLEVLLRRGLVVHLSEKEYLKYMNKTIRNIRANNKKKSEELNVTHGNRSQHLAHNGNQPSATNATLPKDTSFVAECEGQVVDTSATLSEMVCPGVRCGNFSTSIFSIIKKIKQTDYPTSVREAPGLRYDNCDASPGMHHVFPRPGSRNAIRMGQDLQIDMLLQAEKMGYSKQRRVIYASRLRTDEKGKLQEAHSDCKKPQSFDSVDPGRPVACLFPTTEEGCFIQLWPTGSGFGRIVRLELGEILFFEPHVIHAGGLGSGCPRVQAYLVNDEDIVGDVQVTQYYRDESQNLRFSDFCWSCVEKR